MKCPFCNYHDTKVVDSRPTEDGAVVRRRRQCMSCKERLTTYEKIEQIPIIIIKKDGNREQYDRNKVIGGIVRACEKRPVSMDRMEEIADDIESKLHSSMDKEIKSDKVGELVMEALEKTDKVAYVRFASVYKDFRDIDSFYQELDHISKKKEV